jgi:predicted kinase
MKKYLKILVGPPGAGKSTLAQEYVREQYYYVNQDSQGKIEHKTRFHEGLFNGRDIIIDRLNFNKEQRERYIKPARDMGYHVEVIVLHENYETCLKRCLERKDHETINYERAARSALRTFFCKYERPTPDEADLITFKYPEQFKPPVVVSDLDGTLCNTDARQHHVQGHGKKNWKAFFEGIPNDPVNKWCSDILVLFSDTMPIILCSGRSDNERKVTEEWLTKHGLNFYENLFMRDRHDHRADYIVKEIILDFEILTRYTPHFFIDDRKQVVDMWRSRGYTCLQCAPGDF